MKKTAQFGLNQWEMSDCIQMQDFNRDNAAIEAALAKRNCQFYTASYIGDGEGERTHTFPAKPVFVLIISVGYFYVLMHNAEKGYNYYAGRAGNYDVTWTEDSVTLSRPNAAPDIANTNGTVYSLFAILNAE